MCGVLKKSGGSKNIVKAYPFFSVSFGIKKHRNCVCANVKRDAQITKDRIKKGFDPRIASFTADQTETKRIFMASETEN